jgi:Delta3,5-Delta2,4-dienoyl-CoA isomerase
MNDITTTASDLHGLPQHMDPGRRELLTCSLLYSFQKAIGAQACLPRPVIAAMHSVVLGLVRRRRALRLFSDATFREKEANVGLAADTGTLARAPKLVGNASLSYELALSASTFGAEEVLLLLGLVSRVVPGSRAEVVRAAIGVCGGRRVEECRGD